MNEFISRSSFLNPSFVSDSAWLQHIPFAFWLVEKLKPGLLVELGVHTGVSYFAFCQSVKHNEINCLCYGIDTWEGDEHAGFYGDEIYSQAVNHNNAFYSGFSSFIRTHFDKALSSFEDGSIDLLHIDGYHTYEAVKKDFENWKPKLSNKAVVLFHDINVREKDFGVFKLWAELKNEFPNFEFNFGYGLGVVSVGNNLPEAITSLLSVKDQAKHTEINLAYENLGVGAIDKYKIFQIVTELNNLQARLKQKNEAALQFETNHAQNNRQIELLQNEKDAIELSNTQLQTEKQELLQSVTDQQAQSENTINLNKKIQEELQAQLSDTHELLKAKQHLYDDLVLAMQKKQAEIAEKNEAVNELQKEVSEAYKLLYNQNADFQKRSKEQQDALNESDLITGQLKKQGDQLQLKVQQLLDDLSGKEKLISTLTMELTELNSRLITQQSQMDDQSAQGQQQLHELENSLLEKDNLLQEKEQQLQTLKQQIESTLNSYEELSKTVDWYKRTYELRSFPGVIKEKFTGSVKNKRVKTINALLNKKAIQKKYVATFLLQYIKEHGVRNAVLEYFKAIKNKGIDVLIHPRKQVLLSMNKNPLVVNATALSGHVNEDELNNLKKEIELFNYQPKISIIITTYNTKPSLLIEAIECVKKQIYQNWELCIVDDCSTESNVVETLGLYTNDKKVKIAFLKRNLGISGASNAALKLAAGDFIALMDHDDIITPDALFWNVKELNIDKNIDILYSDECKSDEQGNLSDFFFKPDWSPELLFNMMYVGHLTVYRKKFLFESVGTFRQEYDFSQDYDLMLRATEKTTRIKHISKVLYHWRLTEGSASQGDKPFARMTNLAALEDAMERRHIDADIIELPTANRAKIKFNHSLVSIIVPTDSQKNLTDTINNIVATTAYGAYEIIAVTNSGLIDILKKEFASLQNVIFVPYNKPYNFSDKCNKGVEKAKGEFVIIFNDDVRALHDDWIENTIEMLHVDGVGGVSPRLIYENDTIQYAGMATGVRNLTGTTFHCYPKDSVHYVNFPQLVRNVSILSGACLAMRKSLFIEIGGFDIVNTPIMHSDLDLSFKLLERCLRCVYTPYAELRHFGHLSLDEFEKKESKTKKDKADIYLLKRWTKFTANDLYFTEPMRNYLYHDSSEYFKVYAPAFDLQVSNFPNQDILLVSHEFTLSGAPLMLLQACKVFIKNGSFVTVVCNHDGPLRQMLLEAGAVVIIDALVFRQHPSFLKFAKNFDQVICSTVVTWPVVKQVSNFVNTTWWVHEAKVVDYFTHDADFVETLRNATTLICNSDYSAEHLKVYNHNPIKILYGNSDIAPQMAAYVKKKGEDEKIIFSVVGGLESRKGQDIMVNALKFMDQELLKKMEVWFIGRFQDTSFKNMLAEMIKEYDFVKIKGGHTHEKTLELIAATDVIVCPSRDEPFSVVLMEGFCLSKICIASSNTGISEFIKEAVNGFVFSSEDARDLAAKLSTVINNRGDFAKVGKEARKVYEDYLTIEQFETNMLKLINTPVLN